MLRFSIASHWIIATRVFPSERQCSVFGAIWASRIPLSQQVNGNAPFFRAFFGVFGDIERICSVFQAVFKPIFDSKVGGLNRSEWVGMLRFRHVSNHVLLHSQYHKQFECNCQKIFESLRLLAPIFHHYLSWQ